ncbi:hypothetical protein quinque_005135 [Culex quinquefasciatus]
MFASCSCSVLRDWSRCLLGNWYRFRRIRTGEHTGHGVTAEEPIATTPAVSAIWAIRPGPIPRETADQISYRTQKSTRNEKLVPMAGETHFTDICKDEQKHYISIKSTDNSMILDLVFIANHHDKDCS